MDLRHPDRPVRRAPPRSDAGSRRPRAGASPAERPRFRLSKGRCADAASARTHQRADAAHRPASRARSAPSSGIRAFLRPRLLRTHRASCRRSNTRITVGTWSSRQSRRWALKICGTSVMSASVGASPWQKRPVRGSTSWRSTRLKAGLDPMPVPAVLVVFAQLQVVHQVAQHAQVVQRVDLAGDVVGQRAHARATGRVGRQQRRRGVGFVEVLDDRQRLGQAQRRRP